MQLDCTRRKRKIIVSAGILPASDIQIKYATAYVGFHFVTLEQVYATILYYLHNKEAVSKYVADWLEWNHQQVKAQQLHPSPAVIPTSKQRSNGEGS